MPDSIETESLEALASQMGSREALGRIIGMYAGKLPGEIESLRVSLAEGDLEAVESTAHRLKSSSGQLGAGKLAVMLSGLELSARDGDADASGRILAEVEIEAVKVVGELEAFSP